MEEETKNKGGRPTTYTTELADKICDRIARGESVLRICKDPEMPAQSTVYLWLLNENNKEFSEKYAQARNSQAEVLFDELLDIADDGTNDYVSKLNEDGTETEMYNAEHVNRSRLRVDTRKWYLSKVLPKKYGDKMDFTSGGKEIKSVNVSIIDNATQHQSEQDIQEELPSDE